MSKNSNKYTVVNPGLKVVSRGIPTEQRVSNLNELEVVDLLRGDWKLRDPSVKTGETKCYFRNIRDAFLSEMPEAHAVVGCVAWLTDKSILRAMSKLQCVSLIVQKEDFLRPDSAGSRNDLRKAYSKLPRSNRFDMPYVVSELSMSGDPTWEPVRCVGNHNQDKAPAHPRMHHKFVVFCGFITNGETGDKEERFLFPYKVWTGSYNITSNGGNSLENAIVTTEQKVVNAYFDEWRQVACLSEPLDWTSPWAFPEHRIGS